MDEPFSAIDAVNRMALQKYLVDAWLEEPRTVIYVTHDIDEAIYLADRIAIMTPSPGRIATVRHKSTWRVPAIATRSKPTRLRAEITEIMHRLGGHRPNDLDEQSIRDDQGERDVGNEPQTGCALGNRVDRRPLRRCVRPRRIPCVSACSTRI